MSKEVLAELRTLLPDGPDAAGPPPLPQLFVGTCCVAGPDVLERLAAQPSALHDALRAAGAMMRAEGVAPAGCKCADCGGMGFRICPLCHGSRKVCGACAAAA